MPDVEIRLGGRTFNLRPTFGAMREIEAQCKSSCATLLQLLARHEMHSSELTWVVYHGMKEAGEDANPERVGELIFQAGVGSESIRRPIAEYLAELLYAPDSARKKAVGEWFEQNEEITSLMFASPPMRSAGDRQTSTDPLPENFGQSSKPSVKETSA